MKKFWHLLWKDESWKGWVFSIIVLIIFIKLIFFPAFNFMTGTKLPLSIVESCSMYHNENFSKIFERDSVCENGKMKLDITGDSIEVLQQSNGYTINKIIPARKYFDKYEQIEIKNIQIGSYIIYESNNGLFRQEVVNITKEEIITIGEYPCKKGELYNEFNINLENTQNWILKNGFTKGDILFAVKAKPEKLKIGDIIIFQTNKEALRSTPIIHRIVNISKDETGYIFSTMGDNNAYQLKTNNNIYNIDETSIKEDQLIGKPIFKIAPLVGWAKLIFFEWQKPQEDRGFCK